MTTAEPTAVETTVDVLQILLFSGLGVVAGLIVAFLFQGIGRYIGSRQPLFAPVVKAVTRAFRSMLAVVGGWIGFSIGARSAITGDPEWRQYVEHALIIVLILVVTWFATSVVNGIKDSVVTKMKATSESKARRVRTQMQILHRVIVALLWLLGVGGVLLTFPGARAAGASLMASAGIVSVVAGLAAQSVLGNVFAGLQLAFSDSIRVGDIIVFQKDYTSVEEITLTYVVLSVWDGRRIIVPSSKMTSEPFENWTRRALEMTGTVIWEVDWDFPIAAARKQYDMLLRRTDLWDGRTGVLLVDDAKDGTLTVKGLMSAKDSATLTDLKNYIRENIVLWIQSEAPQAIPRRRRYIDEAPDFDEATAATSALVEARVSPAPPVFVPDDDPSSTADLTRTTIMSTKEVEEIARIPIADRDPFATVVMDPITTVKPGHEASIFTGSPQAEERAKTYAGPGDEAFAERQRKAAEEAKKSGLQRDTLASHGNQAELHDSAKGDDGADDGGDD